MYLTKNDKRFLNAAIASVPDNDHFYAGVTIAKSIGLTDMDVAESVLDHLEKEGCVKRFLKNRPDLFQLTELGRNYKMYSHHVKIESFINSILCPIAVTLITEAIIHGLPLLLKLLQAWVQKSPS